MEGQSRAEFQSADISCAEERNPDEKRWERDCGLQICCGKRMKIPFLQTFATPTWALLFLSFGHWLDEAVANGLFGVTLASVEKQFQIRSTESGYIGAMMDVGAALTVVLSAYYGEVLPKPRSIGISVFLAGIGCFVYVIPQFASTEDFKIEEVSKLCGNVTAPPDCFHSSLRSYRFVFMLGMLLCGFGIEYPPTLGISYLDENTSQERSSLFNGILYGAGGFGPLFGYLLEAATLQMENSSSESLSIDNSKATRQGGWWVGFIAVGSALIISSIPVYLLPKNLENGKDITKNREQKTPPENDSLENGYWKRLAGLLSNPIYICISLWVLMYECLVYAIATYAVKVFSVLLGMSESTAGFLLGGIGVGVSVVGYVLGGVIVSKFKFNLRGIVRFVFCCNIISLVFVFGFLLPCSEKEFAGARYSGGHSLLNSCNDYCGCTMDYFSPVCDNQGVTYYSPCYAGCDRQVNGSEYQNCKCVEHSNSTSVSAENCGEQLCENAYAISCVMVVSMFFGYVTATPSVQATIRSVRFDERTMALSIQHIFLIICGRVLGRVMFAKCFDDACLLSSSACGEVGTCRLYEKSKLAMNITILLSSVKFVGVIFAGLALFFIERQKRNSRQPNADGRDENEFAQRDESIPRT